MILIWGGTISGYCAVGSFDMATAPAIVMRIAMTIATIGLRTKKAPTGLLPRLFRRRRRRVWRASAGVGRRPPSERPSCRILTRWSPSTTIRSPGFKPSSMTQRSPSTGPTLTTFIVTLLSGTDDRDLVAALQLGHGPLRHQDRALLDVHGDAHLGVLAGSQEVARVRKGAGELDRAGLHVHLAADEDRPAAVREDRAVGEDELQGALLQGLARPESSSRARRAWRPRPGTPARSG